MENNKVTIKETHIFFIIFILGYIGAAMLARLVLPESTPYWLIMCFNQAAIILPIIAIMLVKKIKINSFLMFEKVKVREIVLAYVCAYSLLPLINLINYCSSFFVQNHVTDMMEAINAYPLWAQLILLAVFPAVAEEFIFRGFFYGRYREKNIIKAMLMSGLFFGIAHLNINQFAYAFVIGVAFCLLYEASGNILLPMTAHFAINANTIFQIQLLNSADDEVLNAAIEAAANMQESVGEIIINIAAMFGMSVLFTTLFVWVVAGIAKKHGRTINIFLAKQTVQNDTNVEAEERFIDIYWVMAVVPSLMYMIALEMV